MSEDPKSNQLSKELMRVYLEDIVAAGHLTLIESISNADMIDEANMAFGGPPGRDGLIAHVKGFRKHIENLEVAVKKIVGDDNEVMAWWSFKGNHTGPWMGIPPTGEFITGTVFSFFSLTNGRIARYKLWLHAELNPPVTFDSSIALSEKHQSRSKVIPL